MGVLCRVVEIHIAKQKKEDLKIDTCVGYFIFKQKCVYETII